MSWDSIEFQPIRARDSVLVLVLIFVCIGLKLKISDGRASFLGRDADDHQTIPFFAEERRKIPFFAEVREKKRSCMN